MGLHSKRSKPVTDRMEITPITAAVSIGVHVTKTGEAHGLIGWMNLSTRKYVFAQLDNVPAYGFGRLAALRATLDMVQREIDAELRDYPV